jgi:serine/threonine protein kinase
LFGENAVIQAHRECAIHAHMQHPNIVKLEGYYEDADSINLIIEHCNDANYLEHKLEEVSVGDSRNTRKSSARKKSDIFPNKFFQHSLTSTVIK